MDRPSVPLPIACARVKLRRTWTDVRLFWTANWRFFPSSMSLTPTEVFVTSISFSLTRLRWYIRTLHVDEPSVWVELASDLLREEGTCGGARANPHLCSVVQEDCRYALRYLDAAASW